MGTVRLFTHDDAEACAGVVNAAVELMDGLNSAALDHVHGKNTPDRLCAELLMYHSLVYERDGRVVGVGALDGPEIKRLYVEPGWQRSGVGRTLVRALEWEARHLGFDALVLDASPSSEGFWERLGYRRVRADTARWDEAEFQFVHMRKELPLLELGGVPIVRAEPGGG